MTTENDTEYTARANLAFFYKALEAITANTRRRTFAEELILDGFCAGHEGLCQFRDANALAEEFCLSYNWSRLNRKEMRKINAMIQLARALHGSRHVAQNEHGAHILLGSNGVVPAFCAGEDWVMAQPGYSPVAVAEQTTSTHQR